jgi:hypothetical protein
MGEKKNQKKIQSSPMIVLAGTRGMIHEKNKIK